MQHSARVEERKKQEKIEEGLRQIQTRNATREKETENERKREREREKERREEMYLTIIERWKETGHTSSHSGGDGVKQIEHLSCTALIVTHRGD